MRLQKLTSLEVNKLIEEYKALQKQIEEYNKILNNHEMQSDIIKEELDEVKEQYGDKRQTEIIPFSGDLAIEDMIPDEEMVLTISHNGYIKRLPSDTWRTQRRGGRGMKGAQTKDNDFIEHLFVTTNHSTMLFFTDQGKCYWLKVHQIPQTSRISQGRAIVNLIGCDSGEKVEAFVSVKEFNDEDYIVMCTKNGLLKRSKLSLYSKPRKGGIYAIQIKENDQLIFAKLTHGNQDIILATSGGKAIRFNENQARPTGRKTQGVTGIRMSFQNDIVIGMLVVKREGQVMVATNKGYGKRSNLEAYRQQKRGGKGVYTLKTSEKVGQIVSIMEVVDEDDIMIITTKGIMIRQSVSAIRTIGRNTQGVRLIKMDDDSFIASITKIVKEEDAEGFDVEEEISNNDPSNG